MKPREAEGNGAHFDPQGHSLTVYARRDDLVVSLEGDYVVITIENLTDGIEIYHEGPLWRGAK